MPSFLSKLKALATPSSLNTRNSKSANDISYASSQFYIVKEKDLPKLQAAAWKGDYDKVAEHCKPGKLDASDKEGRTALHLAVAASHKNIIQFLLDQGAKLNVYDKDHRSPLTIAALNGNIETLSMLLNANKAKAKILVNEDDVKGLNVLHYVVRNEKASSLLRILLNIDTLEINHEDADRNTALHVATMNENAEVVKLLMDSGADLDAKNRDGCTPLILASMKGSDHIMRLLVERGCDKQAHNNNNKTAEDYSTGRPACLDVLKGFRQSKSFNMPSDKKNSNIQVLRSPSLSNEITLSERTKNDKFEKLFAGGGASTASNMKDSANDSDTSQIIDDKQADTHKSEKISSWNDSDLSFADNNMAISPREAHHKNQQHQQPSGGYDSIFQNFKTDDQDNVHSEPHHQQQQQRSNKPIVKKQDSNASEENSWIDDSSWIDIHKKDDKKQQPEKDKGFSFLTFGGKDSESYNSKMESWFIYVHTSNLKNAGTDARIFVKVFGTKGNSNEKIWLEKQEKNKALFEKGSVDRFVITLPDIGKPTRISMGHDNSGAFAGWHLDKVILQHASQQHMYTFNAKRWLAKDEDDGKIEIDIEVEPENGPPQHKKDDQRSWNSSGDEDSSISMRKPIGQSPKTPRQLNQINEELNETTGSKKSSASTVKSGGGNNNSKQVNISNTIEVFDLESNSEEISMNNLSAVEKLISNLITKPKLDKSSDSHKDLYEKSTFDFTKVNNNSSNNESTDLVDLLLNEMYSSNDSKQQTGSMTKKLSSISLVSLEQQAAQNKTSASTLTQVTQLVTPLNNTTLSNSNNHLTENNNKTTNVAVTGSAGIMYGSTTLSHDDSSNIFIRPFSSMSDPDNDVYQASARSFVQLTGASFKHDSSKELIEDEVEEIQLNNAAADDEDQLQVNLSSSNRIINFAALTNKQNRVPTTTVSNKTAPVSANGDKMNPRETTSWANQQRQHIQQQAPPGISDIEDDDDDNGAHNVSFGVSNSPFYNRGPMNTFSKGLNTPPTPTNKQRGSERGIDVPYEKDSPKLGALSQLVKNIQASPQKKEDLVDLGDWSDEASSSHLPPKNSSKYKIENALVKPIIATQPHHGLVYGDDEEDVETFKSDTDKDNQQGSNTGKFSIQTSLKSPLDPPRRPTEQSGSVVGNLMDHISMPNKDSLYMNTPQQQSSPVKNPTISALVKPGIKVAVSDEDEDDEDTEYENEEPKGKVVDAIGSLGKIFSPNKEIFYVNQHSVSPKAESKNNSKYPTISSLVNPNEQIYEDVRSDSDSDDDYEKIFNTSKNSNKNQVLDSIVLKPELKTDALPTPPKTAPPDVIYENIEQIGALETLAATLSPEKKKWTNFNEIDKRQSTTSTTGDSNSTIGKLISPMPPPKAVLNKEDDQSDDESSEMRTSKIEELINKFQPNQTTWKAKMTSDNASSTESTPSKKPVENKFTVLGALASQSNVKPPPISEEKPAETSKFSVIGHLVNQNMNKPSIATPVTAKPKDDSTSSALSHLMSQIIPKKPADHDDDKEEELIRRKRAEQEKELEMAKKKQKDHGGSLSSDFEEDDDEFDAGDGNEIVVEPPIAFSKHSGNASSSLGTYTGNSGGTTSGGINKNVNINTDKKFNLIDVIDFSTSDSDIYLNNDLHGSETNNFKKQFDLNSNNTTNSLNVLINQQLKTKQSEVLQLKQLLDEALKQKKQIEDDLKASNDRRKDLEAVLVSTENVLAEKERSFHDAGSKTAESDVALKKNSLLVKDLQNEINDLKSEKKNLLAAMQTSSKNAEAPLINSLNEQNEIKAMEIKALKNQIEELNMDRTKLSENKEELSSLLEQKENHINEHKEALEKVIIQFKLEKAVIKDENAKLKVDIAEASELKKKLADEIQQIKVEIRERKLEIEKLTKEKTDLERSFDRETNEKERLKRKYDDDIAMHKEQHLQLIEKLGFTEAKLISVEKEYKYCKSTLQEKQAQLDELKDSLNKLRSELSAQESLLNKEKEEKIRLSARNESIEERLKQMLLENSNLKREQRDIVETNKFEKIHSFSLKELERKKLDSDKEINLLKQDLNLLNQKLYNAELELKNQKNTDRPVYEQNETKVKLPSQKESSSSDNKDAYMEESKKLKAELDQLRGEFHLLLSKYEVPENDSTQHYPTRDTETRPQDLVMNRLRSNRVDVPSLLTHGSPALRNLPNKHENYSSMQNMYQPAPQQLYYSSENNNDYYTNGHSQNHPSYDSSSRTTIIVPNFDIILPNSDHSATLPSKLSSKSYHRHSNGSIPCEKCISDTQNYIDIVRHEIARTVDLQAAKEQPLASLTYKSSISNNNNNTLSSGYHTNKLDNNYDSLRNSIIENSRYTSTNFDLVNSLRSKYFV